ncbi:MAG TPA: hypothetical protein VGE06_13005 [Flavisolibacter sp.]
MKTLLTGLILLLLAACHGAPEATEKASPAQPGKTAMQSRYAGLLSQFREKGIDTRFCRCCC